MKGQFEIIHKKKPFNTLCRRCIEYVEANLDSPNIDSLDTLHQWIEGWYEVVKHQGLNGRMVRGKGINISKSKNHIHISKPMACESAYLTIKLNPHYDLGRTE